METDALDLGKIVLAGRRMGLSERASVRLDMILGSGASIRTMIDAMIRWTRYE
jgi:hypothetical protein